MITCFSEIMFVNEPDVKQTKILFHSHNPLSNKIGNNRKHKQNIHTTCELTHPSCAGSTNRKPSHAKTISDIETHQTVI